MSQPISIRYLLAQLKAGTATPEEQKQAAPFLERMAQLGQAAIMFAGQVQGIMDQPVAPPQPPNSGLIV